MDNTIGSKIANRLKAIGKPQSWLAEQVGVSVNAVSKWIRTGKIATINARAVAKALGISTDQLLGQEVMDLGDSQQPASRLERLNLSESDLIQLYRASNANGQRMILAQAKLAAEQLPRLRLTDEDQANG